MQKLEGIPKENLDKVLQLFSQRYARRTATSMYEPDSLIV